MAHLTMKRGDTRTYTFTFADEDDAFQNGDTVRFTIKRRASDSTALLARSSANGAVDLDGSTATVVIPSEATTSLTNVSRLLYDLELTTVLGEKRTLDEGTLIVTMDITSV